MKITDQRTKPNRTLGMMPRGTVFNSETDNRVWMKLGSHVEFDYDFQKYAAVVSLGTGEVSLMKTDDIIDVLDVELTIL